MAGLFQNRAGGLASLLERGLRHRLRALVDHLHTALHRVDDRCQCRSDRAEDAAGPLRFLLLLPGLLVGFLAGLRRFRLSFVPRLRSQLLGTPTLLADVLGRLVCRLRGLALRSFRDLALLLAPLLAVCSHLRLRARSLIRQLGAVLPLGRVRLLFGGGPSLGNTLPMLLARARRLRRAPRSTPRSAA